MSGLVMLLPHGYDGQGPEHSNARPERFLASVNDDYLTMKEHPEERTGLNRKCNIAVCNITSSANYYHILKKQVKRTYRKPLVIMAPKKLLRHKGSQSKIEDFLEPSSF